MGTSITSNKSVREKGLVANHVYSILQVVCEDGIRCLYKYFYDQYNFTIMGRRVIFSHLKSLK